MRLTGGPPRSASSEADGLIKELRRLAGDGSLRERMGAAGRERTAAVFGVERFVAQTAELYEQLAARKGVGL